jgi:hypothetical protein
MKTAAPHIQDNSVYSFTGCELELLGRKSSSEVFARRMIDGHVRIYFNHQLRHEGGAPALERILQVLPKTSLKAIKEKPATA